jgi:hypothetical protein
VNGQHGLELDGGQPSPMDNPVGRSLAQAADGLYMQMVTSLLFTSILLITRQICCNCSKHLLLLCGGELKVLYIITYTQFGFVGYNVHFLGFF